MNTDLLEEILSCPSLPTLPAVALRVIELTSDSQVSLQALADTIHNDQGLSAKVLRTVNSSFYGLRTRCATINKALVMLGLSPVKSLVLGFSLVSSLNDEKDDRFDYIGYWRRGLYTAVAAKCIAEAAGLKIGDEAFLGGLLQDVGQMAMYRALGDRYIALMKQTGGDHRQLASLELSQLDIQHADVGAMLAQRWKLPDELVLPVKYHERPTAAPNACVQLVLAVGLGNIAHDALSDPDPGESIRKLYAKGHEWFNLDTAAMDSVLRRIAEASKEMSSLFRLDTGKHCDPDEMVRLANQKLIEVVKTDQASGEHMDELVSDSDHLDPLTGAFNREEFEATVRRAFQLSRSSGEGMTVLNVALDGIQNLAAARGQACGDEALVATATLLKKHFEPLGGATCRVGAEIFAVVFLGAATQAIIRAAGDFHTDLRGGARAWSGGDAALVSAALGVASFDAQIRSQLVSPGQLVTAAARAVREARAGGGDTLRIAVVGAAAA